MMLGLVARSRHLVSVAPYELCALTWYPLCTRHCSSSEQGYNQQDSLCGVTSGFIDC